MSFLCRMLLLHKSITQIILLWTTVSTPRGPSPKKTISPVSHMLPPKSSAFLHPTSQTWRSTTCTTEMFPGGPNKVMNLAVVQSFVKFHNHWQVADFTNFTKHWLQPVFAVCSSFLSLLVLWLFAAYVSSKWWSCFLNLHEIMVAKRMAKTS